MNNSPDVSPEGSRWPRWWPWALLLMLTTPALWHVLSFPDEIDREFPGVVRPTFSTYPPPAYRLAEPGDTIDRVAIYVSSIAVVLSLSGLTLARGRRSLWVAALTLSLTAFWFAATPGPTFDGWHGLGFQAVGNPSAPARLRVMLAVAGVGLLGVVGACLGGNPGGLFRLGRERRVAGLFAAAGVLTVARLTSFPDVEPFGYWPRWAFVWALVAFCSGLVRVMPRSDGRRRTVLGLTAGGVAAWFGLVWCGIWLTWYHRPLERLREVVPGRIYMSAMPTFRGLEIAQGRHHFKTIINLFPEDTPFRSPRLAEELRFARGHGLTYVQSPAEVSKSNAFLDRTLGLAQDPDAWPILVHCHACMDRTPAWVGIYRFVVEGAPLGDVMRFIEGHRGYRPKASVTLLYNRVLPRLAPERFRDDPTGVKLRECAAGTADPYYNELRAERGRPEGEANASAVPMSEGRRPSLTPRR